MNNIKENRRKVYGSIEILPAQIEQAWSTMEKAKIPANFKDCDNIIVCGMGGSNIGFHLVRQALADRINVPIIINADYKLPKFTNRKSLVILSSYSGNTEEVLSCANEVLKNEYKGYIISGGGKLSKLVGRISGTVFSVDFNPSNEPRWGLGYSIGAFLKLLQIVGALDISEEEVMKSNISQEDVKNNGILKKLYNKQLIVVAAEHLVGNAHIFCNQMNETADNMATYFALPEFNHHFLEAFSFPKQVVKKNTIVLFMDSVNYSAKIKKRIKTTQKVLNNIGVKWVSLCSEQNNPLCDSLSTLQLASYLCYYMSVANKVDPIAIPTVDFFKNEIKK